MKLKHFSGYGSVNAKKLKLDSNTLVVEVRGEHERGLELKNWDVYSVYNWLVKRFDRKRKDWMDVISFDTECNYISKSDSYTGYEEIVKYTIHLKNDVI